MKFFQLFLLLVLFSCTQSNPSKRHQEVEEWMAPNGKLKVLSTIAMINDLVKRIGGDQVDALTLITLELDPHSYQLVKGDDEILQAADLIFFNGLGLEHGPSLQSYLSNSTKSVGLGNLLFAQHPELIIPVGTQIDPHIWMDISLWTMNIPFIVQKLSEKLPEHAADFKKRGDDLLSQLLTEHQQIKNELSQIPAEKRYLVTSHDAFNYFTKAYLATDDERKDGTWQVRFTAPEGLAPDSQISLTDIQTIINHLAQYHIHVLFPESNVSQDSLRKILIAANEKGIKVKIATDPLYGDSMGRPGSEGDTYPKMVRHNVDILIKYFNEEP